MMKSTFTDVILRMQSVSGLKNGSQIAHAVGITPQAMTNYRKRDAVPAKVVVKFSNKYGISVDWLMYGTGDPYINAMHKARTDNPTPVHFSISNNSMLSEISNFSPDELITIGKFVSIMRNGSYETSLALKNILDLMMKKDADSPK